MPSTAFPVVKGTRLRATKINSCGMPVAGPGNRIVTKGFVSVNLTKVTKDAADLTQENADGEICVQDRTPPLRRWYTPAIELCNVDPELITMLNGWTKTVDYAGTTNGFIDDPKVETEYGVALEIWTGGRGDDDCPTPTVDTVLSASGSGRKYGYFLFGGTEWDLGDITISADVATFTMTGRTIAMPHWGKGPYNVVAIDSNNTAGRLLTAVGQKEHLTVLRTSIAPPDPTLGAAPLATSSIFTTTNYYYGGPASAPPIAVAPAQPAAYTQTLTVTGMPTGGNFTLVLGGHTTANIAYNATAAGVQTALAALDDGHLAAEITTSGGALPGTPVVISLAWPGVITFGTKSFTGGTSPNATLT